MDTVEKLVRLLKSRGYSQEGYEARMGWAKGRISKWIAGQGEPFAAQMWAAAQDLAVDVSYLLDPKADEPRLPALDEFATCTQIMRKLGPDESFRRLTLTESGPLYAQGRQVDDPSRPRRKGIA